MFWLSFIFSFILYTSCILPLFISSFLSFLPLDSFVYLWQKEGEYTRVYRYFYMTYMHILKGRNSTSCTFIEGESHRGDAYTKGEKTFHLFIYLWENLILSYFTLCLFSRCFIGLWVMFSIYTLLPSLHCVYVLDMRTSLCHCAFLVACLDDHLLCYVIIVVISI